MEVKKYFNARKKSGVINIYSYFTGAGGLDLGFEFASSKKNIFKTIFSTDIEKWVEDTINHNRREWNFHRADIQKLSAQSILESGVCKPDIIIGGPPCQPFSVAGKQKATSDALGTLYRNYIEHINFLKPSFVLMENVYGLAQVKSVNMIEEIYNAFNKIGYKVTHKELLSANYGTPQKRRRLFFVAAKDLNGFKFPSPTHSEKNNNFGLPSYNGAGNSFKSLRKPKVRK